jgi:thioredoxin 1
MPVINVANEPQFRQIIEASKTSNTPVFIKFTATWCGPCRAIQPTYVALSEQHPSAYFLHVDVDEFQDLAMAFGVRSMPTFVVLVGGVQKEALLGANKPKLITFVATHTK